MATITAKVARKYKDLDLSFLAHPIRKDVNKHVDELAVINSVKNLLLTNRFERPFQPELGSNINALLFENMDKITASLIKREIEQTISNFEPRVGISEIVVKPNFDNNLFEVGMTFFIVNRTEPITIEFFLQRDR